MGNEYDGPERRDSEKMFHDIDTRMLKMEIALLALKESAEGRHKRMNEKFDAFTENVNKMNAIYFGNGAKPGMFERVQHIENLSENCESDRGMIKESLKDFKHLLIWVIGIVFVLQGWGLVKLYIV